MRYLSHTESAKLSIVLDDGAGVLDRFYSNGDIIQGEVLLAAYETMTVEGISIVFIGQSTIITADRSPWARDSSRSKRVHTFLNVSQPLDPRENLINLAANETPAIHRVAFAFTVPTLLLPHTCKHISGTESLPSVAALPHLLFPPSLNMSNLSHSYNSTKIGQAKVEYMILARLKVRLTRGGIVQRIATYIPVRVEPCIGHNLIRAGSIGSTYREAHLLRRLFSRRQNDGHLSLRTTFSASISSKLTMTDNVSLLMPSFDLEFTPGICTGSPPHLHFVKVSLKSFTICSTTQLPGQSKGPKHENESHDGRVPTEILELGHFSPNEIKWQSSNAAFQQLTSGLVERKDEDQQYSNFAKESKSGFEQPFGSHDLHHPRFSASLEIPVNLTDALKQRNDFQLVPTLSNCVVERSYSLEFRFSFKQTPRDQNLSRCAYPDLCITAKRSDAATKSGLGSYQPRWWRPSRTQAIKFDVPVQVVSRSDVLPDYSDFPFELAEACVATGPGVTSLRFDSGQSICPSPCFIDILKYQEQPDGQEHDLPSYRTIVDQML